jgi:hypothetical protein
MKSKVGAGLKDLVLQIKNDLKRIFIAQSPNIYSTFLYGQ